MTPEQQTDLTRFMFLAMTAILNNQAILLDDNEHRKEAREARDVAGMLIIISEKYLKGE